MPGSKDSSKPRGRISAYAFFMQTLREEVRKEQPDESLVFSEFSKKCAERWKALSEEEKKQFHDMADKDKKRYELEMKNYVPPKVGKGRGKKRRNTKDPNAPKRPLSAFFWFCNDERAKVKERYPQYGVGEVAKQLGILWSELDPETKKNYYALADRDKDRYAREKEIANFKMRRTVGLVGVTQPNANDDEEEEEHGDEED